MELEKDCLELGKRTFYCRADAEKELELFISGHKRILHSINGIAEEIVTIKRKAGRPKKGAVPETETTWRLNIEIQSPSEQTVSNLRAKAGTFVLMTNVLKEEELSAIDILKEYKEQTAVEVRFRFLKDPVFVDGIYVKNRERVLALSFVFLMALLIYALLERRVRQKLKEETEPLILPGKRKSNSPTGTSLLEMLKSMQIVRIVNGGKINRLLPKNLVNTQILRLLKLVGFDDTIYTMPKTVPKI
ncbi:transposase [Peptococcaceae bacterium DYL19]|nr:transposase [Phosphitispora fastidiosa]